MATVTLQPQVGLTLVDESGSSGQFGLWIRSSTSAAQGRAAVAALRSLLPSSCRPITARVVYTAEEQAPALGAGDKTKCAVLVFETNAPGQLAVIVVPGMRDDLVDPTAAHRVNIAAFPIQALITALQSGLWCNPFGYIITNCIAGIVEIRP